MPKINFDERDDLFEPIEFVIDGKTYAVKKLTDAEYDAIGDKATIAEQFAEACGVPLKEVREMDYRKLTAAMGIIVKAMNSLDLITLSDFKKKDLNKK